MKGLGGAEGLFTRTERSIVERKRFERLILTDYFTAKEGCCILNMTEITEVPEKRLNLTQTRIARSFQNSETNRYALFSASD